MKTLLSCIGLLVFLSAPYAQSNSLIEEEFDLITSDWLKRSDELKTYEGVNEYCRNPNYRKMVNNILGSIHEYDSMVLAILNDQTIYIDADTKEQKKTLKDVNQLEEEYSVNDFIEQMRSSCLFRNEIEANADNLKNGVGIESYDGKVLVLETEIGRYLNRIDKLVLRVDDHLHLLHLENN